MPACWPSLFCARAVALCGLVSVQPLLLDTMHVLLPSMHVLLAQLQGHEVPSTQMHLCMWLNRHEVENLPACHTLLTPNPATPAALGQRLAAACWRGCGRFYISGRCYKDLERHSTLERIGLRRAAAFKAAVNPSHWI